MYLKLFINYCNNTCRYSLSAAILTLQASNFINHPLTNFYRLSFRQYLNSEHNGIHNYIEKMFACPSVGALSWRSV